MAMFGSSGVYDVVGVNDLALATKYQQLSCIHTSSKNDTEHASAIKSVADSVLFAVQIHKQDRQSACALNAKVKGKAMLTRKGQR